MWLVGAALPTCKAKLQQHRFPIARGNDHRQIGSGLPCLLRELPPMFIG